MASLRSALSIWVLKGCIRINQVGGERAFQTGDSVCKGTEVLWIPRLSRLHGMAAHTHQEKSGTEAGKVGWAKPDIFLEAMRSHPTQSGSDIRSSNMLVAVRMKVEGEGAQRTTRMMVARRWARGWGLAEGARAGSDMRPQGGKVDRDRGNGCKGEMKG